MIMGVLTGCANREQRADALAKSGQFQKFELQTNPFRLVSYGYNLDRRGADVTIYLAEDGAAWVNGRPPLNPTPTKATGLRLASTHRKMARPDETILYIARPCHFVRFRDPANCTDTSPWWSSHRFAPEVIRSTSEAIDHFIKNTAPRRLTLVGYSGGGTLATLLAAHRSDVSQVITMAGTIDLQAWVVHHNFAPLYGSLNPPDFAAQLRKIKQYHYVGGDDDLVPPLVAQSYRNKVNPSQTQIIILPGHSHNCCWTDVLPQILGATKG